MTNDNSYLIEIKLIILYIINKLNFPITNVQLTEIILKNNLSAYFNLQHYIVELTHSNLLVSFKESTKEKIFITDSGKNILELFSGKISPLKKNLIDKFISENLINIKRDISVLTSYNLCDDDTCLVSLKIMEGNSILIDLKVNSPSQDSAIKYCENWKKKSLEICNLITKKLSE